MNYCVKNYCDWADELAKTFKIVLWAWSSDLVKRMDSKEWSDKLEIALIKAPRTTRMDCKIFIIPMAFKYIKKLSLTIFKSLLCSTEKKIKKTLFWYNGLVIQVWWVINDSCNLKVNNLFLFSCCQIRPLFCLILLEIFPVCSLKKKTLCFLHPNITPHTSQPLWLLKK